MNRIRHHTLIPLILLLLLLFAPRPRAFAQTDPIQMDVQAGFDGFYKTTDTVPVIVTITNAGTPVEGELHLTVGDAGVNVPVTYAAPISLPTQSNKQVALLIDLAYLRSDVTVQLVDSNGTLTAEATSNSLTQIGDTEPLVGIISPEPAEFSAIETISSGSQRPHLAQLSIGTLPEYAAALSALNVLIIDETDTSRLTPSQLSALDGWVQTGGQLVVTGGPNWQPTAAALRDWLPVAISGTETIDSLPALADFSAEPFRDPGPYLVAASSLTQGELLIRQDSLPLLAARPTGQGTVYFLALDPKLAPLKDWDGAIALWSLILDNIPDRAPWANGLQDGYATREAISSLPSLTLPSVAILILFLAIYILLIGPINYLVLKRLNRRELAWVTIPVLVLLFSGFTYIIGFQIKGNDTIINQMAVSVGEVGSRYGRVSNAIGLYSPRRAVYTLTLPGDSMPKPPPNIYSNDEANFDAFVRSNQVDIRDIRTDVSEVALFQADIVAPLPEISAEATLITTGGDIQLILSAENNSSSPLNNLSLLAGDIAYPLPALQPGDSLQETITLTTSGSSAPFGAGSSFVLTANAETLLRSSDYYNDPVAYPRYQLLQAIENSGNYSVAATPDLAQKVTLVGWNDVAQISAEVDSSAQQLATTLYLLDIPLATGAISSGSVTIPSSLLTWEVIDQEGVYEPTPDNVYLNGGRVDIGFRPWSQFDGLTVEQLNIVIEPVGLPTENLAPELWLFNGQTGSWQQIDSADWGIIPIPEFAPFIDAANTVQIRLVDRSPFGVEVSRFYPELSGQMGN